MCTTGEVVHRDGSAEPECTLRAAIEAANARAEPDSVSFDIPGAGLHVIALTSALPALAVPLVIDATTQPGYSGLPLAVVDGGGIIEYGFILNQGDSILRGLAIGGFTEAGVVITGPGGNRVEASHIGTDASGTAAMPNATGVRIQNSPDNVIGGSSEAQRNVISGNVDPADPRAGEGPTSSGIVLTGSAASGNRIEGNYIGTDASGAVALGNGYAGIYVHNAPRNVIGGNAQAAGNVVSGNERINVYIFGGEASENQISGNVVGTDAEGTVRLSPEASGVVITYGSRNVIGGPASTTGRAPGNLISGNDGAGVAVVGVDPALLIELGVEVGSAAIARQTHIAGNLIGTSQAGADSLANGVGVLLYLSAEETRVGGGGAAFRNVISGNRQGGIVLADSAGIGAPDGSVIAGNFIGTTAAGTAALGNRMGGVMLTTFSALPTETSGVAGVLIGGPAEAARNVIAGNDSSQVRVDGARSVGTVVQSNYVGLLSDGRVGQSPLASTYGIRLRTNGAGVGVDSSGTVAGNVIGGNRYGVKAQGNLNVIQGNLIGSDPAGTEARANEVGVWVLGDGTEVLENVISGNTRYGLLVGQTEDYAIPGQFFDPSQTLVVLNRIGTNRAGTGPLGNGLAATAEAAGAGVALPRGAALSLLSNVISGNAHGVVLSNSPFAEATTLQANRIGVGAAGAPLPNRFHGVWITNGQARLTVAAEGLDNEGGGAVPLANVIAHNGGAGVRRSGSNLSAALVIKGNSFVGNGALAIDLGEEGVGAGSPFPTSPDLHHVTVSEGIARIVGTATAGGSVELYASEACDPSGHGQGRVPMETLPGAAGARIEQAVPLAEGTLADGYYVTALTHTATHTSEFSRCVRVAPEEDTADIEVIEGLAVRIFELLAPLGMSVELDGEAERGNGSGGQEALNGTLYATRFRVSPDHNAFSGEATSDDGTIVRPDVVADARYWTLTADGLTDVSYSVCLHIEGLAGVEVPGQLVVLHRERIGRPWVPQASTLADGSAKLCASGLTAFGDLGVGGDIQTNPVPVDPEADGPQAFTLSPAYPNPARGVAGFALAVPSASEVRVEVYDVLGRRVAVLHDGPLAAGEHAITLDTSRLAPGLYVVRAAAPGGATASRRLTVVR